MAMARKDFDNGVVEFVGTARYSVSLAQFRQRIESVMRSYRLHASRQDLGGRNRQGSLGITWTKTMSCTSISIRS